MPLLDHFRLPVARDVPWESFHSNWATRLADALNAQLPPEFMAEEQTHAGSNLEIDVATMEESEAAAQRNGGVATATERTPAARADAAALPQAGSLVRPAGDNERLDASQRKSHLANQPLVRFHQE